jgi:hypothetical protein
MGKRWPAPYKGADEARVIYQESWQKVGTGGWKRCRRTLQRGGPPGVVTAKQPGTRGWYAMKNENPITDTLIDLSPFCDPEARRWDLAAPRLVDGMVVATDGRILIRCQPEKAVPFETNDGRFPKIADIMENISGVSQWGHVAIAPCDVCQNAGVLTTKCNCVGDCSECDMKGERHELCECSGRHSIGEFPLRSQHAYLVGALPGVEWQLSTEWQREDLMPVLYFRFLHGDGAVTPQILD